MDNEQRESIIQKCFAISTATTEIGKLTICKVVDIERIKKLENMREKFIDELIDYIKSLQ